MGGIVISHQMIETAATRYPNRRRRLSSASSFVLRRLMLCSSFLTVDIVCLPAHKGSVNVPTLSGEPKMAEAKYPIDTMVEVICRHWHHDWLAISHNRNPQTLTISYSRIRVVGRAPA